MTSNVVASTRDRSRVVSRQLGKMVSGHADNVRRAWSACNQPAKVQEADASTGATLWPARISVPKIRDVRRHWELTAVCQVGCWVDRQAWRCRNPDAIAPARRPATEVLLAKQHNGCCVRSVVQRSSLTYFLIRGSAWTRPIPRSRTEVVIMTQ